MKKVIIWHLGTASTLLITQDKCGLLEVLATIKDKKKGKGYFRNKQWKECFISERNRTSEYIWNWFKGLFSFSTKELEPVRKLPLPWSKLWLSDFFFAKSRRLSRIVQARNSCHKNLFSFHGSSNICVCLLFWRRGISRDACLVCSALFASQFKTFCESIEN